MLVVLAASGAGGSARAQAIPPAPPAEQVAPAVPEPPPALPPTGGGLTREQALARIAELEAEASGLGVGAGEEGAGDGGIEGALDEPSAPEELAEVYRQIVQWMDAERAQVERAEAFRRSLAGAAEELARLQRELEEGRRAPLPAGLDAEGPGATTVDGMSARLAERQAELAEQRAALAQLTREVAEERARPSQVAVQLGEAQAALEGVELELEDGPAELGGEAERAAREVLLARQRARAAEIAALEQERISHPARLDLLAAQRDLAALRVSRAEARTAALEERLLALRQEVAERAGREAAQLAREAIGRHPLIQELAEAIAETTRETEQLVPQIDQVRARQAAVDARLARTLEDLEQTQRALEQGITRSLGTVLLEQRRQLPDARVFRRRAEDRSEHVTEERLEQFTLERRLRALADEEQRLDELLARAAPEGLSAEDRARLRAELGELLATHREQLELLRGTRAEYLEELGRLEAREQELLARAQALADVLDERLLWIPDARPVGAHTLQRLVEDARWVASASTWGVALGWLRDDLASEPVLWIGVALLLAGLALARRRMDRRLDALARRVGDVRTDGVVLTVQALLLQVLWALPGPAAVLFVGWRIERGPDVAKAVGTGLAAAALVVFLLQLVRTLCRANGVARAHFGWQARTERIVRRNLLLYLFVAAPAAFLVAATQASQDTLLRHGLGRLAFVVLMVAAAALAWPLLHPSRGLLVGGVLRESTAWLRRTRALWLPLALLVTLSLAALACAGYYYAALQLELRLNQTLAVVLAAIFLNSFLLRWLSVSHRRLALRVALDKRAALAKSRAAGEEEFGADTQLDLIEEIDVEEIEDQTQDLVRVAVGFLLVVGLWFAWVGVMPALGVLDDVTLWHHEVTVDGVTEQRPITLASVGLALLLVVVTVTAARKLPGFLEIAVLQRLPVDQGVRYAVRSLVLYTIVAVGVVIAFNTVGVGWSSVQWLLAALTVGLGFGLQEIFANFVSGLIILLERPVRVGDTVTVGEVSGVVSRIRMRATTITDWKRRELVVPNKSFITGELINWSLSDPILRLEFVVGIAYGSDTALAHRTMLDVCREHPLVLNTPEPNVFFLAFGDNSLNFEVRVFTAEPSNVGRSRITHELHMAIDRACREREITIAFPQRDLHLKSAEAPLRVTLERPDRAPAPRAGQADGAPEAPDEGPEEGDAPARPGAPRSSG